MFCLVGQICFDFFFLSFAQANPPMYLPVIEVIPSVHTSREVVERTADLMKELGKVPVVEKKELNGFVLNRLQYAIIMEAWRLVEVTYTPQSS